MNDEVKKFVYDIRDVLNSTYTILPLSGLPTLTGQRTLTVSADLSVVKMDKLFLTYSLVAT